MPARAEVAAYIVIGGGLLCWWRHTLFVAEGKAEAKGEVGANGEEL